MAEQYPNLEMKHRLLFDNGLFTVNEWRKPAFRNLSNVEPDIGLFDESLSFIFKSEEEKDVFLDWLSWCLQNEDDKPSWAIFLVFATSWHWKINPRIHCEETLGEQNASEQQGIKPIISRFNKPNEEIDLRRRSQSCAKLG